MLLNGRAYEFNHPLPSERVKMGSIQLLEIFHAQSNMGMGGMNMTMPHPIHLHGQQFEIMSRSISGDTSDYDSVREGFIDSGLKDTVLVMPMERIKVIKPFQDFKGLYLYHCHNLEHEDMGMMREFLVE
jgi:FtsP/CotA-like multicopper oxidase with cupredoxin domain